MDNKIITLKDIAKQLNVSVSSVSRALNNHPSIGLRTTARVQQLAKELNYEPNQIALLFKKQKTNTIGVIIPNLNEEFFSQAINAVEDMATEKNFSVLIGQSHDDVEKEKKITEAMKNHRVDGLLVSITKHTKKYDHFQSLSKYNIPIVFFDRVPNIDTVHKVSSDITSTTNEVLQYLIKAGHKRIGLINGPDEMGSGKQRLKSYIEILHKRRLKVDMSLVTSTDLTKKSTNNAMYELLSLKSAPTAIVTVNDYVAMDAIQFAKSKGIKINTEIAFVSYANLPITTYLEYPPLASVEQFPYEQAKKATEILFEEFVYREKNSNEKMESRNIYIPGRLIVHQ